MVPFDRALVSSYRLSIRTKSLSAAVRPQFATEVYLGALPRVHVILQLSMQPRSHLLTVGRRQYGRLPQATAELMLIVLLFRMFMNSFICI